MKRITFYIGILLTGYICSAQQRQQIVEEKPVQNWTVENSIATRYFETFEDNGSSFVMSPDGNYFFVVSKRGNLKKDLQTYRIQVFSSDAAKQVLEKNNSNFPLIPQTEAVINLSSFREAPIWTKDSKSILFIGAAKDTSKFCILNISNGVLKTIYSGSLKGALGPESYSLFKYNDDASAILFFSMHTYEPKSTLYDEYPELAVTSNNAHQLANTDGYDLSSRRTDYLYYKGKVVKLFERLEDTYKPWLWLSPNSKKIITIERGSDFYRSWIKYYQPVKNTSPEASVATGFDRFVIVNSDNANSVRPLVDAPVGTSTSIGRQLERLTNVLWTTDNKYAILVNTALPIKMNQKMPDTMSYIVSVNIENGNLQVLEPLLSKEGTVNKVSWNEKGNELLISYKENKIVGYKREGEKWMKDNSPQVSDVVKTQEAKLPQDFKIFVRQDASTPPRIVVSNDKNEIYLSDRDTALENVYIATSRTIRWKMSDGTELTGGLTLPKGYETMKPLPLVIQNYGFEQDVFRPDGISSSGYATQLLVANGFAVVQLDLSLDDFKRIYGEKRYYDYKKYEGSFYVEKLDAVVAMLSDSGLVDPQRVALIGFSRGGFETLYAITHPVKVKFTAAMCLDSYTGDFSGCVRFTPDDTRDSDQLYQGSFWKNKAVWLKEVPEFNIDKVRTPLLYSSHGWVSTINVRMGLNQVLSLQGAFKMNKRPLELLLYPKAFHELHSPQERYAALTTTLDWMNFWLKGKEDTNPAKEEKYTRWREFRKMQDAVLKEKEENGEK